MNEDRIEGAGHEIKGAVKEAAGKITGDKSTEVKGKIEKNVGSAQREVGEIKEDREEQDPRSELGLKSPVDETEKSSSLPVTPEDYPARPLGKESRNDQ